jgi:hypothetical protein
MPMNRLQLAQRGYEMLAPALATTLNEETSDRAERWLRDEVCPVFAELAPNRSFRLAVRWSRDHLTAGANSPARQLVEAVESALVRCARELASVTVADPNDASNVDLNAAFRVEISRSDRATIELIAERPWLDLVCVEDFFHPMCELCLRKPDPDHTHAFRKRGELRVPLGDYIARCMVARIDYWKSFLDRIWNETCCGRRGPENWTQGLRNRLFDAKVTLDQSVERLKAACRAGIQPQRREACVTLTQVYAGYATSPVLDWLGFPRGSGSGSGGLIRSCVRRPGVLATAQREETGLITVVDQRSASLCDQEVLQRIAASLADVVPFYQLPEDPDDLIDWAAQRARLVLVDRSPRAVWWDGNNVAEGTWDTHLPEWNLLWILALNLGKPVDQMMLMRPEKHPIKSRRHRLTRLLNGVLDLDNCIETLRGQGYALLLPVADVFLLRDAGEGKLVFEGRRDGTM